MFKKLFSPFDRLRKRIHRVRLRRMMRGYRVLKQSGHLDLIALVKQDLTEYSLGLTRKHFSSFVMGAGVESGEIILRQYLLVRIGYINLNRALLLALGKVNGRVIFPLPKMWRSVLVQHGFEVAHFRSAILWQFYVCVFLLYGVVKIVKIAFTGIIYRIKKDPNEKPYACFIDLAPGNLPQIINGSQSHDVVSWFIQWPERNPNIEAIHHSVVNSSPTKVGGIGVLPQNRSLPTLTGWRIIINYLAWGIGVSVIAVLDCLRGRWWHALLLNQAAMANQVRMLPVDSLAREYLFHNSGWIYRPLWTYEAEQHGSTITLYFYSTNCESFKKQSGYPSIFFGYKAMNWPHYLAWDIYQEDFLRRAIGKRANISVVGPIWFQSSAAKMPILNEPCVAVFDVTPHRWSIYCMLGLDSEFYTPAVANPFLIQVSEVIQQHGALMLWKRKRNIGRIAHPHYRQLANQLSKNKHIVLVEPDISAIRVIESSFAVISMPFTSTALIAREMGKPSIYYDPTGLLQRDDRAAHGIPIISNSNELKEWVSLNVKHKTLLEV